MKKLTIPLFVVFLALGVVLCLPATIAKAEDASQADTDEKQIIDNGGRDDRDQAATNEEQGDVNEGRDDEVQSNESSDDADEFNGEKHRSSVSTFVQSLLNVADKERGGLGEQVKEVAQAQNESIEADVEAIDKIKNRSQIKTFLIGTDYKNIGKLRSATAKTENQVNKLNDLLEEETSADTKTALQAQVQILTREQQKIEAFIKANESRFSLFGWFVKLFNK